MILSLLNFVLDSFSTFLSSSLGMVLWPVLLGVLVWYLGWGIVFYLKGRIE